MTLLLLFNQPSAPPTTAYLRGDADAINADNWINEAGSTTGLFNSLDEVSFSDADYILSPAFSTAPVYNGLTSVRFRLSDPTVGKKFTDPVKVRYRVRKTGSGNKSFTVKLLQGTTQIVSWNHTSGLTTSFQTIEQTLTGGQVASISDWNDLYLQFDDGEVP